MEQSDLESVQPPAPGKVVGDVRLPFHILIAEDHEATCETLAVLLERKAYHVTTVADGASALRVLTEENPPCIAVIDWGLPDLTGVDVCRALRKEKLGHYTYLIIVTARDQTDDVAEALAAGADDFIRKPYVLHELVARVRSGQRVIELERNLAFRIRELEASINRINQLQRLLPICMYCKKVRADTDYWREIETYIHEQAGTDFSHGICPDCLKVHFAGENIAGLAG
jgi:sigma-B regulation protein RsbU (phosphoserine phosphatase)